jgi:hypothetical protein
MPTTSPKDSRDTLQIGNYVVSFIDLLGQKAALEGQGLLPEPKTEEDHRKLLQILKASIGSIAALQKHASQFLSASEAKIESPMRALLPEAQQSFWDEIFQRKIITQRWSDGVMHFICLGDDEIKCPMNGVEYLLYQAGMLCLIGLATKRPIRGAIEIAWGVELEPGELYGAAVARAYELESKVADYPRIVIGPKMIEFLHLQARNPHTEKHDQVSKNFALNCLNMLVQDADGHWIFDYLGAAFSSSVSHEHHQPLYEKGLNFIHEQLAQHRKNQDTKLAFRYVHLLQYFLEHPPAISSSTATNLAN